MTATITPEYVPPPHPWDATSRRRGLIGRLAVPIFLCVLLPLAAVRLFLLAGAALGVSLMTPACMPAVIRDPALSFLGRLIMLCFGVWPGMLRVAGHRQAAPVCVVAPHVGLLDAFFFMSTCDGMPRPIALEPYTTIPVVGGLFRAANGIAVPLPGATDLKGRKEQGTASSPKSGGAAVAPAPPAEKKPGGGSAATKNVRDAIIQHKKRWEEERRRSGGGGVAGSKPIVILPEGTTHNGHALLKFFSGAFEGGGPIQPILLKSPHSLLGINFAHFSSGLPGHLASLLLSPWVALHVRYLPVYTPSAEEAAAPELFAEGVRAAMATASGLPLSSYGARDLRREYQAQRANGGAAD